MNQVQLFLNAYLRRHLISQFMHAQFVHCIKISNFKHVRNFQILMDNVSVAKSKGSEAIDCNAIGR